MKEAIQGLKENTGMKVYFDNSATTKPAKEVIQSMTEVLERYYGNPSSLHHLGAEAEQLLTRCREQVAVLLNVDASEIIFTSGGTESNNLAIKGVAFGYQKRGKHIITTQVEHPSVYEVCQDLEKHFGFEVTYLQVDENGIVSVEDVKKSIREDTILVSIMHVNNELGSVQPISEIGKLLQKYPKLRFHVDQVQGSGKVPLSIKENYIDLLSLSGHKIHAPKGTGILFVKDGVKLYPLLHGGAQQQGIRPGTENVAGSVAFAKALRMIKERELDHIEYLFKLKEKATHALMKLERVSLNSSLNRELFAPHIINASFQGLKPEILVHALEQKGIYVSTKSACSSKIDRPSRVLIATGISDADASSSLRISFSIDNRIEEVDYFAKVIQQIVPHYQNVMKV
jgi:cysteine desulfurase